MLKPLLCIAKPLLAANVETELIELVAVLCKIKNVKQSIIHSKEW